MSTGRIPSTPCGTKLEETDTDARAGRLPQVPRATPSHWVSQRNGNEWVQRADMWRATSWADLAGADPVLNRYEYPFLVWSPPEGTINLASEAAAELLNVPLDQLVGSKVYDYVETREATQRAAIVLAAGDADGMSGSREIRPAGLGRVAVKFWTRVIELEAQRRGVAIFLPSADVVARFGPDPAAPWRGLMPVAVGLADGQWRIREVTADISNIVARTPHDLIGIPLLSLFDGQDVANIGRDHEPPTGHFRRALLVDEVIGDEVSLMIAPWDSPTTPVVFAIVGAPDGHDDVTAERIFDLEMRLRRIGAEVRAAGVLDALDALPRIEDHPKLGELTTRQQEVLGMLLQGQRVAMIASQLYVSQSTVRNHLATIFHKFSVHSQAELLELLTPRAPSDPNGPLVQRNESTDVVRNSGEGSRPAPT